MNFNGTNRFQFLEQYKNMHQILPNEDDIEKKGGLWLGDYTAALDKESLQQQGIKTVLTTASGLNLFYAQSSKIEHHSWYMMDHPNFNIAKLFDEVIQEIDDGLRRGGVLIHCAAGISRSATCVIAYLMKIKGMSFPSSINFVKKIRKVVQPNPGFIKQLQIFEKHLAATQKDYKKKARIARQASGDLKQINEKETLFMKTKATESEKNIGRNPQLKEKNNYVGGIENQMKRNQLRPESHKSNRLSDPQILYGRGYEKINNGNRGYESIPTNSLPRNENKQQINGILKNVGENYGYYFQQIPEASTTAQKNIKSASFSNFFDGEKKTKNPIGNIKPLKQVEDIKDEIFDANEEIYDEKEDIIANELAKMQAKEVTIKQDEHSRADDKYIKNQMGALKQKSLRFSAGRNRGQVDFGKTMEKMNGEIPLIGAQTFFGNDINFQGKKMQRLNSANQFKLGKDLPLEVKQNKKFGLQPSTSIFDQIYEQMKKKKSSLKSVTIVLPTKEQQEKSILQNATLND